MRQQKTLEQLRAEAPNKYVFSFVIGSPKSVEPPEAIFQGVLPVDDLKGVIVFSKAFQSLLLDGGFRVSDARRAPKRVRSKNKLLTQPKPPKGMVAIKKKKESFR